MPGEMGASSDYWEELWLSAPEEFPLPLLDERTKLALSVAPPGSRVLDAGCGDGRLTARMAGNGAIVTGVDVSERALERARRRSDRVEFVKASPCGNLPFDDCSFDAVFCSEVLNQVVDTAHFLSELRRVLKPAGQIAITAPFCGAIKVVYTAVCRLERAYSPLSPVLRFYTKKSLRAVLAQFGFVEARLWTEGGLPFLRGSIFARARRGCL